LAKAARTLSPSDDNGRAGTVFRRPTAAARVCAIKTASPSRTPSP
jgi:hypothetical protein